MEDNLGSIFMNRPKEVVEQEYNNLNKVSIFRKLLPVFCFIVIFVMHVFLKDINKLLYVAIFIFPILFELILALIKINKKLDLIAELNGIGRRGK